MKTVFFKSNKKANSQFLPPWGIWGCLWRAFVFLLLLAALIILLSLFRGCTPQKVTRADIPRGILNPPSQPLVPIDSADTGGFPGRLSRPGPDLPRDSDNFIRPIDPDSIISNDSTRRSIASNRLNVILNSDANDEMFQEFAEQFKRAYPDSSHKICYYETKTKLMQLVVPSSARERIKREINHKISGIQFKCFEEEILQQLYVPNDNIFGNYYYGNIFWRIKCSWYFAPIQTYEAWDITKGSPDITVAIVDSYFDLRHPDLNSNRIVKPYSVRFGNGSVAPAVDCNDESCFKHGSMVASIAIGTMNNGIGTSGIAPNCKFMPISLGHGGYLTSLNILQGLLYAIYQGADVVNLSLGQNWPQAMSTIPIDEQVELSRQIGLESEDVWTFVSKMADERNVTLVWAAGNETVFTALDPMKRWKNVINVSAIDEKQHMADFSNYGYFPSQNIFASTVSAPGVYILGAAPYSSFDVGPGTSFAAPIVTGAIALMKSVNRNLSNEQIVKILQETGKPVTPRSAIGPILQIKDAVERAKLVNESPAENSTQQ